jgi:pilus assembly protein CpaF
VFSIIISEKGGAERRESFDKNEINVGRVQGNDLMLPKGNVSKHHARLLFRDGRFIVTDLKSTNGTYVNGRKIAQATIVREGDKIYIGDFVLRLETNGAGAAAEAATTSGEEESIRTIARDNQRPPPIQNPPAVTLKAPTHPPGAPLPRPQPANVSQAPPIAMAPVPARNAPEPPPAPGPPPQPFQSAHGMQPMGGPMGVPPQDQDPDDSAPLQRPRGPSAVPPVAAMGGGGTAVRPMTMPLNQMSPPVMRVPTAQPPPGIAVAPPPALVPQRAPEPIPMPAPAPLGPPPQRMQAPAPPEPVPLAPPPVPMPVDRPAAPSIARATMPPRQVKEPPAQAARKLALTMLMGRIADAVDLSPLRQSPTVSEQLAQQIDRAAREQADAMRDEGEAPQDVDLEVVVRDAHRELLGLGAFGPLLEDEEVTEIHCLRFDQVFAVRGQTAQLEGAFSHEEALARIIARLCAQSGEPWRAGEAVIERRLMRATFVAIAPPAAASHVVSIRKRRRVESSLEELARQGALTRPMAQFLEACVAARANVLVTGGAPMAMLAALAASGTGAERICLVQDVEDVVTPHAHAVTLTIPDTRKGGEDCVRAASKLHPDRLVVTLLAGGVAAATVDAMTEGTDGVVGALSAPTLRHALSRLVAQLALHRPGTSLEGMRDVVGETFDVAVEVAPLPDGRVRVMRIAELGGSDAKGIVARDVFVWSADPQGGEGAHGATGVVPRIANDLASKGAKLDASIFKRGR